jgi:DNA primase
MRFPPTLLDEIRARLPVSQVVGRRVQLKRAGREYKGLSPFKTERTPSFTVNDQKGFYHCFATGEHGDIFTFLMKTEGLDFPEAVERLAQEAGVPMPKAGPRDAAAEDQRTRLYQLLAASATFFEKQLAGPQGQVARQYLARRGLNAEGIARFKLGYAPKGRSALKEHLAQAGFTAADMAASGMLIAGNDIPVSYDRFYHRIMFPIADMKGRIIAFGGRALDPDAPAKYLNSPETPLFHKGANLYNAHNARGPAHDRGRIVVVEGYMDVIAMALAGFPETVAPLGTALTDDQIKLLWRMANEPTLCFDGDAAGHKAAFRAVETVLPHLKPGFSLQFVFLENGLDPDDFVRQRGSDAMRRMLEDKAQALFDVLMKREESLGPPAVTPEQVAALEARLKRLVGGIADPDVKARYSQELRETLRAKSIKLAKALAPAAGRRRPDFAGKRRDNTQPDWRVRERASERARLGGLPRAATLQNGAPRSNGLSDQVAPMPPREILLVGALLNHPWLIESHCEEIAEIKLTSVSLQRLKEGLLTLLSDGVPLDHASVRTHLSASGLESVAAAVERALTRTSDKFARPEAAPGEAEAGWRHAAALHETQVALPLELQLAERAWRTEQTEEAWGRIVELHERLGRGLPQVPDG